MLRMWRRFLRGDDASSFISHFGTMKAGGVHIDEDHRVNDKEHYDDDTDVVLLGA
jgi:hypothetical protein